MIDVRGLGTITVDKSAGLVTPQAPAFRCIRSTRRSPRKGWPTVPPGSCPTVGLSGHVMGGGHGLLARSHGLTCDSLQQINIVDSDGKLLQAEAASESDLYWACRGGPGHSFGIATRFTLQVFPLSTALVFGVSWRLSKAHAAQLFAAWQAWAPSAPATITSIMKVGPAGGGLISMRCIGQSIGSELALRSQLKTLTTLQTPSSTLTVQSLGFLDAVKHFAGPLAYEQVYMKAKSDYVVSPLGSARIAAMMAAVCGRPRRIGCCAIPTAARSPTSPPTPPRFRAAPARNIVSSIIRAGAATPIRRTSRAGRKSLRRDAAVHG